MSFVPRAPTSGAEYEANRADMLALIDKLRALEARAAEESEKSRERFEKRGQLTPRERLARLLDPGMPFLRLHSLAGYLVDTQKEEKSIPGSSLLVGVGFVKGARCMVWVDDSGIKAGAMGAMSLPVALSVQEMALKLKL
ncbi:MAG: carboxyl transferase domain-containing protein, partial [Pseudomonadota bacterium]